MQVEGVPKTDQTDGIRFLANNFTIQVMYDEYSCYSVVIGHKKPDTELYLS